MAGRPKPVTTSEAPQAIGPYSQAVAAGAFLFTSGQIALGPSSGELVGDDARTQCRRCMLNLRAVLQAAGCDFDDVVKTTIFLVDLADFAEVNGVYGEFFTHDPPARSTVQVAALPLGARVEIDAIAVAPSQSRTLGGDGGRSRKPPQNAT